MNSAYVKISENPIERANLIIAEVANEFGLTVEQVKGKRRFPHYVEARRKSQIRIKEETNLYLAQIGEIFGMDHSCVKSHIDEDFRLRRKMLGALR